MEAPSDVLPALVKLSRHLGKPKRDYVILGDGNTSARVDEDSFLVKASGVSLHRIDEAGFLQVRQQEVLALLEHQALQDAEIAQRLLAARVAAPGSARPSIETILHALALTLGRARFAGHVHPTAWMAILCAGDAEQAVAGRIFTEEILYGGPVPAFVPYADPGLPLAHQARRVLRDYLEKFGVPPKVVLLQNHGIFALGQTPAEVENITAMSVKAARVLLGTYALGGPNFLSDQAVARILNRPDELYRRALACR